MYKRGIKLLLEFINSHPPHPPGVYCIDAQFGKLSYMKDISGAITTRTNTGGNVFIVEIEDEDNQRDLRAITHPR